MDMISRDEWLKALGDAVAPIDPDAFSVTELAQWFGVSRCGMEDHVRRLVRDGHAVRTVKLLTDVNGHRKRVTAYKLVTPPKAKRPSRRG